MDKSVVAFDFDGTIIDISRRDYAVYYDLVTELGGTPLPYRLYWPLRRAKTNIYAILAKSGISDKQKIDFFLARRSDIIEDEMYLRLDSLIPGVIESVRYNLPKVVAYLVTTRYNKDNLYRQLNELKIYNLFEEIIVSEKDKSIYYSQINNLNLIVGDTENDINAANIIGKSSVAVLSGIRDGEILKKYNPGCIIPSIAYMNFDIVCKKVLNVIKIDSIHQEIYKRGN